MIQALLQRLGGWQFVRFLLVGVLNTAFGYALFALFILLGASSAVALAGATILGVAFNFRTIGRLVFNNRDARLLPRFVLSYAVYFLINLACLHGLASLGISPLLAQLVLLPWLSTLNFLLLRRLVFTRAVAPVGSHAVKKDEA